MQYINENIFNNNNNIMTKDSTSSSYKLLLPIGITSIITLLIVTLSIGFIKMDAISKEMINTNDQNSIHSNLLRTMTESSLNRSMLLLEMVQSEDAFEIDDLYIQINQLATIFTVSREKLLQQNISHEQRSLFEEQSIITKENGPLEHKVFDLLLNERYEEAKSIFYNSTVKNRYENIRRLEKIFDLQNKIGHESFNQLKERSNQVLNTILASVITTLLICILLTIMIVRFQNISHLKLSKLANEDVLTGLSNRANLIWNLENTIKTKPDKSFALVFLDIDYFKSINDNYGHNIGDKILINFASKITKAICPNDILSRFGGDEFVLLLKSINSKEEAINRVSNISKMLDTSFDINGKKIFTTSSMGVTLYNRESKSNDAKTLLSQADFAMYLAKESGRNCFHLFSRHTHDKMKRGHAIEHELLSTLQNNNPDNHIFIEYQPLYNLEKLKVTGFEALIRWKNNNDEIISPSEFIPIAEKTNLINKVNSFVIKEVCRQKTHWKKSDICPNVRINFNLSGNKRSICELLNEFKQEVKIHNLQYTDFGIELTERTILDVDAETALEMERLTKLGLKILIDDFGTGYSSLSYLKKLPITTIKIDKSFIAGLPHDSDDKELVKTIITLGNSFKLDIIAEGVETIEQLNYLKDHSCILAQGYYLDRPLSINDVNAINESDYCLEQPNNRFNAS